MKYLDRWALQKACLDQRMTLKDAGDKAEINPGRLYRLSGGYIKPHLEELNMLANVLGVDAQKLLRQ